MTSLATALLAAGAEFSNELTYVPGMAPRSANHAALEREGMQVKQNIIFNILTDQMCLDLDWHAITESNLERDQNIELEEK